MGMGVDLSMDPCVRVCGCERVCVIVSIREGSIGPRVRRVEGRVRQKASDNK